MVRYADPNKKKREKETKIRSQILCLKKRIKELQKELLKMGASPLSEYEHIAANSQTNLKGPWKTFIK